MPELDATEEEALRLIAQQACLRAGCTAAGVTVVRGDEPVVIVGTSLLGRQLEQAQWDAGQGPGVDAIGQLQVFNVSSLGSATSWPDFVPYATNRGVRSSLAVPIILRGRALGALDLYASEPEAFDGAERLGLHFAAEAALALAAPAPEARRTPRPPSGADFPGRSRAVS